MTSPTTATSTRCSARWRTSTALIAAAHERGIRILLDFVPNHTSSDHPWFLDARSSRGAGHRDWYVWRDPAPDGGPPNDLVAQFGGPAWTLDEASGQYWYHSFLPEQPELDWRNPAVRAAMLDHLRFWFERGVDGFRIDVLWMIAKDDDAVARRAGDRRAERVRREPPGRPRARRRARHGGAAGRAPRRRRRVRRAGARGRGLHGAGEAGPLLRGGRPRRPPAVQLRAHRRALGGGRRRRAPSPRTSRRCRRARGRAGCWATTTSRGSRPASGPRRRAWRRCCCSRCGGRRRSTTATSWGCRTSRCRRRAWSMSPAGIRSDRRCRGPAAGPMPASRRPSPGCRWSDDAATWSVEAQREDPGSMLTLHRRLLALRRAEPALHAGAWSGVEAPDGVVAFDRAGDGTTFRVVLNLRDEPVAVPARRILVRRPVHAPRPRGRAARRARSLLRADEGLVLRAG